MTIWLSLSDWMLNLHLTVSVPASPSHLSYITKTWTTNRCRDCLSVDSENHIFGHNCYMNWINQQIITKNQRCKWLMKEALWCCCSSWCHYNDRLCTCFTMAREESKWLISPSLTADAVFQLNPLESLSMYSLYCSACHSSEYPADLSLIRLIEMWK